MKMATSNTAAFRLAFALARSEDIQAAIEQLDALARKNGLEVLRKIVLCIGAPV